MSEDSYMSDSSSESEVVARPTKRPCMVNPYLVMPRGTVAIALAYKRPGPRGTVAIALARKRHGPLHVQGPAPKAMPRRASASGGA